MIICDTHCDVLYTRVFHPEETPVVTPENMKKGGISLQTCTLFAGAGGVEKHPYEAGMREYREFERLVKEEGWQQVFSPLDARDGEVREMLSMEGGEILEGRVDRVDEFYQYGVRMIALTWNRENEIGHPAKSGSQEGIKRAGWEILKRMAELNIAADTSHLNEAGFWDLIHHHSQPPMASHSCVRSICDHFRNLRDDQIRAMIDCGGWIGINFYPAFLSNDGVADAKLICDHIDYICQMGGEKHVGFGSDFDGIEMTPSDVRTPAEVPNIISELRRRGYSENAIADIAGLNFIEYYRRLGWKQQ
ncbi:MAG: membrane dipeptidase [Clostridia bacterium]|nr:membrane dipeptidase [Clostridia bacterium]